jgi:hypothetical protein
MNSIYNDDLAISNSKGTNTMSNNSKTEQVSRTANEAECDRFNAHFCERRNWSHFYSADVSDYYQWVSEFRECGLTRLADRVAAIRLDGCDRDEFTPAEQADLELAEIALRNLSTQTTGQDDQQANREDWQNAALQATEDRDDLRALLASRDTEIDQLRMKVRDLERSIIYLANSAAYTKGLSDAQRNTEEMLLAERRMKQRCQAERQANENCPF